MTFFSRSDLANNAFEGLAIAALALFSALSLLHIAAQIV